MAKAKFGTFDDLLEISEETLRPIAKALRETVLNVDQNAVVCVKFCKKESGMLRNVGKLFGRHRESAYVAGRRCR